MYTMQGLPSRPLTLLSIRALLTEPTHSFATLALPADLLAHPLHAGDLVSTTHSLEHPCSALGAAGTSA